MQIYGPTHVHGPQSINAPHRTQAPQTASSSDILGGVDHLDISPEAELVSRAREVAGIRSDRVADIRAQIASGAYETDAKLDTALDRLLQEIGG